MSHEMGLKFSRWAPFVLLFFSIGDKHMIIVLKVELAECVLLKPT
jgi:hypothetical protein